MHRPLSPFLTLLSAAFLLAAPRVVPAQAESALQKSDLVRYLAGTTYSKGEIAAIVRRACLAFVPSDRDRQDLRQLGATDEIFREIDRCVNNGNRPTAAAPDVRQAAPAPRALTLTVINAYATAMSGTVAYVSVDLHRGDAPVSGARLVLRGATTIPGGARGDPEAVTDASGRATFTVPAGTYAGSYHLSVSPTDGSTVDGPNTVLLTTLPAAPSRALVTPSAIAISPGAQGNRDLAVTISDAFLNPVPRLTVQLKAYPVRPGLATLTRTTNDSGTTHFAVPTPLLRAGDSLLVTVGNRPMATVRVVAAEQVTALSLEAERQLAQGRSGAEAAYDTVLSVDPSNTRALLGRGYARSAVGKYDAAIQDFQLAERQGEDRAGAHTGLGYVALRRGDLAGASTQFQDALRIAPADPAASTGLAYADVWRIDPRQAIHRTEALASPRPTAYPAAAADKLRAGITLFAARNPDAAAHALDDAASAAPAWADVFFSRALVHQAQGNASAAIADFQRYLQLRPTAGDRAAVTARIAALGKSPGAAFAFGLLPGGGQFYAGQPALGALVLGGVAGGTVWALHQTTTTEIRTFTDPFGRVDTFQVNVTKRKNLAAGAAVAGAVLLAGAVEAALHASSARGDPYPPTQPGQPTRRTSMLPSLEPMVGLDPVNGAPRWGFALRFQFR